MYFPDLTPYQYELPKPLTNVLSVGWLAAGHDFPVGVLAHEVLRALSALPSSHRANQMRGYHLCDLCQATQPIVDGSLTLGSAEMWIPSADGSIAYAAPNLVLHYVRAHHYLPPEDFIRAVKSVHRWPDWNANAESERRIQAAFEP